MPWEETVCGGEHEAIAETLGLQVNVTVTLESFHPAVFGTGETDAEMVGFACSRFTLADAVAEFPAMSVAVPETGWFAPSVENRVEEGQVAIPDNESLQVKLTVTGLVSHPLEFGAGERFGITVGGVLSSLITTVAVPVAPAASVTVPLTGMVAPSVEMSCGEGQLVIGAPPGVQVKLTVTFVLFQPAELGPGEGVAMMVGGVFEIFSVICPDAELPATSVAVPFTTWPAPAVEITCGGVHEAIPESVSAQRNVTVTDPVFHPAAFGVGDALAVMVGAVLSIFTVTELVVEFPATSVHTPLTI